MKYEPPHYKAQILFILALWITGFLTYCMPVGAAESPDTDGLRDAIFIMEEYEVDEEVDILIPPDESEDEPNLDLDYDFLLDDTDDEGLVF